MKLALSIALGIILASLILYAVEVAIVVTFFNQSLEYFQDSNEKQLQILEQKRIERLQTEEIKRRQVAAQKRVGQLKELERKRKEAAWVEYYVVPENCQSYDSDAHMVECINIKMRSKKVFEKLYATNSLPDSDK